MSVDTDARHYALIERAIRYLHQHRLAQPSLSDLAQAVHMSPYHLQRLFAEWAGVSPKRFLQSLTKQHALAQLARGADVLQTAQAVGLSSPSRLHELVLHCEALTPGDIQRGGQGLTLGWGWGASPFGAALLAWSAHGLCHLAFAEAPAAVSEAVLQARWPAARLQRDDAQAADWLGRVFAQIPQRGTLHLVLRGTNFQIKVWEALLALPPGQVLSYGQLAGCIGTPSASRAVGSALAANQIGYLIPCHRVIRASGDVGHYRWGSERKQAILAWEAAQFAD
ncbi:methylated-DNA--[protein]-cysteine S-methyltransferase [Paludibacterium sp. THUN1379]|uniref:methylated-DNA--[protein]-cysteine S-methyltransferase n=1 Tax=Paludibacterium sp. THUN1379 TaxID=3112107 RepID=UPI003085CA44|nr:methylated-DNA--[protein]-cysteine S-methyltransferase [Paludibacterium sp. THUN1379]